MQEEAQQGDYYSSGVSDPIPGATRSSLAEASIDELTSLPLSPARPDWQLTRFPVSFAEYNQLTEEAQQPQPEDTDIAATIDPAVEQEEAEAEAVVFDPPEGGVAAAPEAAAPAVTHSFAGIAQTAFQPPDNTIAVGPDHVLVAVNTDLVGFTKGGNFLFRWPNMRTLFDQVLPLGATLFDPRLAYDHYAQRWIVVMDARRQSPAGSWIMVGVSKSSDPAGAYWVWALDAALDANTRTNNWADYSMLGFDTQGIYISSNMFQINGGFRYAKLRVLRKAELYAGGSGANNAIRWSDHWDLRNPDGSLAFTVQPAVHFRGMGSNPPAYLVNARFPRGNALTLWTLNDPIGPWLGRSANLTRTAVQCQNYDLPPDGKQPDTDIRVETNDTRLLNAVYQNADGVQRLWTCHTCRHTWPDEPEARSVAQWYEIDVPSTSVVQQNRYGAPGRYYYFPAIQTDLARNAYMVFSRSSKDEYAQLRQTGRRVGDVANSLQTSTLVRAGESAYTRGRWGDYFGICRDGGDASTVWMYGEYAARSNTWGTRVCAARFG